MKRDFKNKECLWSFLSSHFYFCVISSFVGWTNWRTSDTALSLSRTKHFLLRKTDHLLQRNNECGKKWGHEQCVWIFSSVPNFRSLPTQVHQKNFSWWPGNLILAFLRLGMSEWVSLEKMTSSKKISSFLKVCQTSMFSECLPWLGWQEHGTILSKTGGINMEN